VRIEKGGKPTVLIAAPGFVPEVIKYSALNGIPYLAYVVVEYDQMFLPAIPQQIEKVFDRMVRALTTPAKELEKHVPGEVR